MDQALDDRSAEREKVHPLLATLWDSSLAVREWMDDGQRQRGADGQVRQVEPHEDTLTDTLIRQWESAARGSGQLLLAHRHPSIAEGRGSQTLPRSGADLEVLIEVQPHAYVNLLLQAKKLYRAQGRYKEWKSSQGTDLQHYAETAGPYTPGMLLYNASDPPFLDPPPKDNCTAFGGCPSVKRIERRRLADAAADGSHGYATPAGVGLCLDRDAMAWERPTPAHIQEHHFPIEHLLHVHEDGGQQVIPNESLPEWVPFLLEAGVFPPEPAATRSVIIPHPDGTLRRAVDDLWLPDGQ